MVISKLVLGVLSVVALATVAFVFQPGGGSEQEELSKLQGEWVLESMLKGGIKVPSDQLYNERLVIESTQFARLQTKPDGQEYRGETGRVSVGLHSKRNAIDLHLSKGTIYGVYEIAGDQLVLCINREGGARPDSLSSVPNDNRVLQHFSRTAKSSDAQQVQPPKEAWTDLWLKKIPSELPKNADDAQKWMKENNFDSILSDELTADMAKKINPDVKFEAYGQLGAKTYLFGRLTSASKFATRPSIEVYCFVNELNKVVSMQVNPTQH